MDEKEWRIEEFRHWDGGRRGLIRQILKSGVDLGKKIAVSSCILVCALPPLVVLTALGAAFSLPSGFYIASYVATDKIMAALLADPPYEYATFKLEEDGYEVGAENGPQLAGSCWHESDHDHSSILKLVSTEEEPHPTEAQEEMLLLGSSTPKVKSELEGLLDTETQNEEPEASSSDETNQDILLGSGRSIPHLSPDITPPLLQQVVVSNAHKQPAHVLTATKLVVHVSNSTTDHTISKPRGKTLILKPAISQGISSAGMQDTHLDDATSKPIEGVNNEVSIWKQINALRTIIGYEAPPHASCLEELRALYVFTGVEPPASFDHVHEMLMFLMAVVGVKE